jgi:hypothetical protein
MYSIAQAVNHDTKEAAITVRRLESSHFRKIGTNSWIDSNYPNKEFFVVVQEPDSARAEVIAKNHRSLLESNGYTIVPVKGNFNDG